MKRGIENCDQVYWEQTRSEGGVNSSTDLRQKIQQELQCEPWLDAAHIDVVATQPGMISLNGTVNTYSERIGAERATRRVQGVRAVANEIAVRPAGALKRTDRDLAEAVLRFLEWDIAVPEGTIKPRVCDGWVTLEGSVGLESQRVAAESAVRRVSGVRGVINDLTPV